MYLCSWCPFLSYICICAKSSFSYMVYYSGCLPNLLSLWCPCCPCGVQKSHLRVLPNVIEMSIDDSDRRVCVWESTSSFIFSIIPNDGSMGSTVYLLILMQHVVPALWARWGDSRHWEASEPPIRLQPAMAKCIQQQQQQQQQQLRAEMGEKRPPIRLQSATIKCFQPNRNRYYWDTDEN